MAFNDQNHRRNNSSPQSIPLQDLTQDGSDAANNGRIRALSDRGRDWVRNRYSTSQSGYSPLAGRDTSPPNGAHGLHLTIPDHGSGSHMGREVTPVSPIDGLALQEAFAGLSIDHPITASGPSFNQYRASRDSLTSFRTIPDTESSIDQDQDQDELEPFPSAPQDTTPLTASQHLQPIAGASTPSGQRHDRTNRRQSVRFGDIPSSPSSARLGDDLVQAEAGLRSPSNDIHRSSSLHRSLSVNTASATLQRAGTMVRNISQRIVNL